ncbi:Ent-kaurene synthase [Periconia macrospinosa]|uniref:Ent-kaurene synthase n=1 Tax=Periconia macrospinosa TaxID=97972 RepID=A0A2V1DH32_9PLEO|nr:Ent-kaurene synthase [Periconia macrospinosa]
MDQLLQPGRGVNCPSPKEIILNLIDLCPDFNQFSSFSTTVYDTAWLSMLYKPGTKHGDEQEQLFPECFEFVLAEQQSTGGWGSYGSEIDAIMNSLAALLALVTCQRLRADAFGTVGLIRKIEKARKCIQKLLEDWDVDSTVHVGFEVLVTGILRQLRSFDIEFTFPGSAQLESLYNRKMKRFVPEMIYSHKQTTILHSLEALVGIIDFDKVSHHCTEESGILASPSATASYLIHAKQWDEKAEKYLRTILEVYSKKGHRGVPSAFPTPIFELTWTLSSMLSTGVEVEQIHSSALAKIASFLNGALRINKGTVGFAPGLISDADDTARTLMTLKLLGESPDPAPMIRLFELDDHFRTYEMEQNPSFSANCNVLLALLYLGDVSKYLSQISKALDFILVEFERGEVLDKWSLSLYYCGMLVSQAFVKLLELHDLGHLQTLEEEILTEKIPIVICRIVLRMLATQGEEGDWNRSLEETSYAVLTITQCLQLPWNQSAKVRLDESLEKGRAYVRKQYQRGEESRCIWVEKVTYESALLKTVYCSMAIHNKRHERQWTTQTFCIPEAHSKKLSSLLSTLPIFNPLCLACVDIILVQASFFTRFLMRKRQHIFSRDQIPMSKDEYLGFIPAIWAMCDYMGGNALSVNNFRDMVWLSLLNYQADEFMETIVGELGREDMESLTDALQNESRRKARNGNGYRTPISSTVEDIISVLRKYISHIRTHTAVVASPTHIQESLENELHTFLRAHIAHNTDNHAFREQRKRDGRKGFACSDLARSSYQKWIYATGADDTSCPFSFQFFACLISNIYVKHGSEIANVEKTRYCFDGAQAGYVAHALARRLAVMCRMYNDLGSVTRDKLEGNLNSLDFDEFHHPNILSAAKNARQEQYGTNPERRKKDDLMAIAEFERSGVDLAMKKLGQVVQDKQVMEKLKVFVDVTDTFGLLYVKKDIASSRIK